MTWPEILFEYNKKRLLVSIRSSEVIRIDILKKDKKGFKENMYVHDAVKKTLFNGTEGKESRERYPEEKIFHLNHEHLHSL